MFSRFPEIELKFRYFTTLALLLVLSAPGGAGAQARTLSAPADDYLLEITQRWGAESVLGDLRTSRIGPEDVELRLWDGYGVVGTTGVVLRRTAGRWSGWRTRTHQCLLHLPPDVGDTLSDASVRRYKDQARRSCGDELVDTLAAATVISADSLEVRAVPAEQGPELDAAWRDAVAAGVLALPPEVPRTWEMLDGRTFVVEVRHGDEYRASVIECTEPPETETDRRIQRVYHAVYERLGIGS